MSNWLKNSKAGKRISEPHLNITEYKIPLYASMLKYLKTLRLQIEFCLYSAWGLIKGILNMSGLTISKGVACGGGCYIVLNVSQFSMA